MRFGVNYTPRVGWFHSWLDPDPAEIARDFSGLRELGLDHVRIFPLWPLLQPNRSLIRPRALEDVASVVRIGHDNGLDVVVDALQGHLSSFDFLPSWATSWHLDNLFTSERLLDGQAALVSALAERLRDEPGALGLSMGNEFIQFAAPRHPDRNPATAAEAEAWLGRMFDAAEAFPGGLHTHSFDDDLFFDPDHPFTPQHAVEFGDVTTVHSWVFGKLGISVGPEHPTLPLLARYLCELATAWSPDPERPVWLQEVGAPQPLIPADAAPDFLTGTLGRLAGMDNLWGVTWWCSHDVSRSLADFPELEYTLGLYDEEGRLKPIGRAYADFIAGYAPSPAPERDYLVFQDEELAEARRVTSPDQPLFETWARHAASGNPPALVAASRATSPTYLEKRRLRNPVAR